MIDFWIQGTAKEEAEAAKKGDPQPPHSSNRAITTHVLNFLFAAQDGSTSSLLWAVTLLEQHPSVLDKVREEVTCIWSFERPITSEELQEMKYTRAVALKVLRYRPLGGVFPHIAPRDLPLTKDYTIPKGAIVVPSVFDSSFQGFTDPKQFNLDRFLEGREEDQLHRWNFLVFGTGSHQCISRNYAVNHLVLFIPMFVTLIDFTRNRTVDCDEIVYAPETYPKDDCKVYLCKRCAMYPSY